MKPKGRKNGVSLFLLVFSVLCLFAYQRVEDNLYNPTMEVQQQVLEPVQIQTSELGTVVYELSLEDADQWKDTLLFYTNHQEVHAYIEDQLVYSLEKTETAFGRTPGAKWNIIPLPIEAERIQIRVSQIYPELKEQEIQFELGSAIQMYYNVMNGSAWELMLATCIIIIGFALFLYWMLVFRKSNLQKEVLYLGLFALIFGIWNFGETQFAVFMFDKRAYWSYLAFTCLMTMCMPALFFFREFLEVNDKYAYRIVAGYIGVETVVCQVLHLTGIKGVKETAPFTMFSIILILMYLQLAIIMAIRQKKNMRKVVINLIGLIILVVTVAVDIGAYFVNVLTANKMTKFGFLIYIVILGLETANSARVNLEEYQKVELLREMALKDMLTGCYNRNAYNHDTEALRDLTGVQIIGFDLNNLKKCNDTLGHMAGDKYIHDAAEVIKEVFEYFGKIYRVGGDEFCIITRGMRDEKLEQKRQQLMEAVRRYRIKNANDDFGIACGYATYDAVQDANLEELRHRADLSMYENKKEIKK